MSTVELSPPVTAAPTYVPVPAYVGPWLNGMQMTPEEYDAIEDGDRGYRYELINGVFVVFAAAGPGERSPNSYLNYLVVKYQESHPNGEIVDDALPEQEIRCGDNRRRANFAIWLGLGRTPDMVDDTPTLTVEFVSNSARDRRRDYVEKRREYAEVGVNEYWVVDRFQRTLTVFRGRQEQMVVKETETYQPPLMPGFEVPVGVLLKKADRYADD